MKPRTARHALWMAFVALVAIALNAGESVRERVKALAPARGICVLAGVPNDDVIELAKGSELLLYVQSASGKDADALRAAAEAAGLFGKRVFVDCGAWTRLQLAEDLADAVLVVGAAAGDGGVRREEVLRVLRPGGRALWRTEEVTKPAADGADSWSHPYHGPDNNTQSSDRLVRAPYLTHSLAEPLFGCAPEVTVAAGGRIFKAFGHISFRGYQNPHINTLYAFSGYNGTLLWTRKLKEGFMVHRSTMVATPEILYLADDDSCKLLDAATGEQRGEIMAPEGSGGVWKWLALENGVLFALLGEKEVAAPVKRAPGDTRVYSDVVSGWPWAMWPGYDYKDKETAWGFGRTLVAMDPKTKKVLWKHQDDEFLDSRGLVLKNGRIYWWCPQKFVECLDARSGDVVWKNSDADLLQAIGPEGKAQHYVTGWSTQVYMKCTDKFLFFAGPQRANVVAASAADGKLLWQRPNGNFQLVLRDDAVYAAGPQQQTSYKLDYLTGKELAQITGRRACTRATGTLDSVFFRGGEGTVRWDVASGTVQHIAPMRPGCHDGVIVADGLLHWGPWICGCALSLFGIVSLRSAGDFDFAQKPDESRQLAAGEGDAAQVKEFAVKPGDWPAYRGNNERNRVSDVALPAKVALRWEFKPVASGLATAPIAAGGMVFVGNADGVVHALNAADGKPAWKAYTGGGIHFPPALWNGRAYVGSNDGRVYAYEAATGRRLWCFRAAPVERKIPVYGTLASTWPVAGGVVADNGIVYAAAGIAHYDGTHVYALDAATGKIKWHNGTSGTIDPTVKNGVSLCGNLSLNGNKLCFNGGTVYAVAAYDTATGQCDLQPAGLRTVQRVMLWPQTVQGMVSGFEFATPSGRIRHDPKVGLAFFPPGDVPADAKAAKAKAVWTKNVPLRSVLVTANAVLLATYQRNNEDETPTGTLTALQIKDGAELWSLALPAAPVGWGVALDADARIVVSLEDGRVLCYGAER